MGSGATASVGTTRGGISISTYFCISNRNLTFILHAGTSKDGLDAVFLQGNPERNYMMPYATYSCSRSDEQRLPIKLEHLTALRAVDHFKLYLLGGQFALAKDCSAFKSLNRSQERSSKLHR